LFRAASVKGEGEIMDEKVSSELFDQAVSSETSEETKPETGVEQSPPPGEQAESGTSLDAIKAELGELKRANTGLIHALTDERSKRQRHEGRLQGIQDTFEKALEARKEPEAPLPVPEEPKIPERMAVEFDEDDGTPFIKSEDILNLTKANKAEPKFEELGQKVDQISTHLVQGQALKQQQKAISNIINADPAYPQAMQALQGQWQQLNTMYNQYIHANGLPVPNSIEEAMGQMVSSPVSQEFQRRFPGSDMELLVETFTTPSNAVMQRKLKRALYSLSRSNGVGQPRPKRSIDQEGQKNLNRLADKPTGFGQVSNQAKSADTTVERVAAMDLDDFMDLSDKDMDAVHSLLQAEES